jgi:3',5'-cyclic AMP phosphodiesterase CpdA
MKKLFLILLAATAILHLLNGCKKESDPETQPEQPTNIEMAVFSDPHYYDPTLGVTGEAFEAYLLTDRKMIAESKAITETVVNTLKASSASVILVAGDLTKDGEKVNHQQFAALLAQLESAGKRVFVIPGNHDINNPQSFSYSGNTVTPVPSVTAAEFATIYAQFGYTEAAYRDANSLSYVVALNTNTWLLAMDGCRYAENDSVSVTGGKFSDQTYQWIKDRLNEAKLKNIRVLGMVHHGLVEHYPGQSVMFPEYLMENWSTIASELSALGLNTVFTGHFHAQDIARKDVKSGTTLFDIETGSLVTWPVPFRTITFTTDNKLKIHTNEVTSVSSIPGFDVYSQNYLQTGMDTLVKLQLMYPPYSLPYEQAAMVSPLVVGGFMAHYHGDEVIDPATQAAVNALLAMGGTAAQLGASIQWMFTDPAPADRNIEIDLTTGTVTAR